MAYQPESVSVLIEHLDSAGFELVRESRGGMGGVQLIYEGVLDGVAAWVEINADRGQWQALLGFGGVGEGHGGGSWAAYLDGTEISSWDIDHEVGFIVERGVEAAAAWRRDPATERKMVEAGRAYMERWYAERRRGNESTD
ncbi:hypothetical protein [Kutzneria sp. 744]|uniref:hypothetical protein n=1 Tax=Kutzneria sp. (strain 744) TaxID=345341 RepID=UPI0003EEBACA|nr:hypothetical protein [Kutzneria sp. 744]EWM16063.1 hypothetical protein KUTG_06367 [Kutzneria sp. 744]